MKLTAIAALLLSAMPAVADISVRPIYEACDRRPVTNDAGKILYYNFPAGCAQLDAFYHASGYVWNAPAPEVDEEEEGEDGDGETPVDPPTDPVDPVDPPGDGNNGHGNDEDGTDESNPGNG